MKENKPILAIYDKQLSYLERLMELFEKREIQPFSLYGFTEKNLFSQFIRENQVELLLVAESNYEKEWKEYADGQILVLRETGECGEEGVVYINKFQSASMIYQDVLTAYGNTDSVIPMYLGGKKKVKLVGVYSPVRRCLQTGFALTLGQILSTRAGTLYLNLEAYCGIGNRLNENRFGNLTDILYYYRCEREKMSYRVQGMLQEYNGLKILPAANSYLDYLSVKPDEWTEILYGIGNAAGAEFMVLDLSEQVPGLFQILKECKRVYTIEKEDSIARGKIAQYELLLQEEYREVLERTRKCRLPIIRGVSKGWENLIRSELNDYVREMVNEDEWFKEKGNTGTD